MQVTWEYIGGFFDGEGSIFISDRIRKDKWQSAPSKIDMSQKRKEVLEKILDFLENNGIKGKIYPRRTKEKYGNRYLWSLQIHRISSVRMFLEKIKDHIIVKKAKALEGLILIKAHEEYSPHLSLTFEEEKKILKLRKQGLSIRKISKLLNRQWRTIKRFLHHSS